MASTTLTPRVTRLEERVSCHEQTLIQVANRLSDHDEVIDGRKDQPGLIARLAKIEIYLNEVRVWVKLMSFVASVLGVSIIGLIWSLLTGAVKIVSP